MCIASHWLAAAGLFVAISQVAVSAESIHPQCKSLQHTFSRLLPETVLVWPSEMGYNEETSEYFSISSREVRPQLIIRPESALQARYRPAIIQSFHLPANRAAARQ